MDGCFNFEWMATSCFTRPTIPVLCMIFLSICREKINANEIGTYESIDVFRYCWTRTHTIFNATSKPDFKHLARYTLANPPFPNKLSISYSCCERRKKPEHNSFINFHIYRHAPVTQITSKQSHNFLLRFFHRCSSLSATFSHLILFIYFSNFSISINSLLQIHNEIRLNWMYWRIFDM